jgi:hypothetical protein
MNRLFPNSVNVVGLFLFLFAFAPDILHAQPPLPPNKPPLPGNKPPAKPPSRFPCTDASVLINGLDGITGTAFFKQRAGRNQGMDFQITLNGLQKQEQHKYHGEHMAALSHYGK